MLVSRKGARVMSESPIREPIQRRSIEKKTKIIKAGLDLFCEKGFYRTNTVEIAKAAGVSTGTVYCYFKDKIDIYNASFEYFLDSYLRPLLVELENLPKPVDPQLLVDKCLDLFVNLYMNSKHIVNELGSMQETNPEVLQYFAAYEDMILEALVKAFDNPNVGKKDLTEKMYLLYALADILGQEHAFRYHTSLDVDVLRQQISTMTAYLFSNKL